jgi:invasion protein IalB
MKFRSRIWALSVLLCLPFHQAWSQNALPSSSQGANPAAQATNSQNNAQTKPQTQQHDDWLEVCVEQNNQTRCQAQQTLQRKTQQGAMRMLQVTVSQDAQGNLGLQLITPLGINVASGLLLKVDEGKESQIPFLTCLQDGCLGIHKLDDNLLSAMKRGNVAKVAFRPFNQQQPLVIDVSLKGFTAAMQKVE